MLIQHQYKIASQNDNVPKTLVEVTGLDEPSSLCLDTFLTENNFFFKMNKTHIVTKIIWILIHFFSFYLDIRWY